MEEIINRTIGPAIDVKVVSTTGLWPILVDAPQLQNALINLCINARDAMPDGGRLTIETGNRILDVRAASAQDLAKGEYVALCVTDTGTDMTPEVIARVFDPFFTTKPIGEGAGLGLSMIYGFVRLSGRQVRIHSAAGNGPAGTAVLRSNERIDLLITDVGVPGSLNGRQVADAGRLVRPGLKVLS